VQLFLGSPTKGPSRVGRDKTGVFDWILALVVKIFKLKCSEAVSWMVGEA
jgi:hypothetical protein